MLRNGFPRVALLWIVAAGAVPSAAQAPPSGEPVMSAGESVVWLDELDLSAVNQGWGRARARQSVEGNPLSIGGSVYSRGAGTHAHSEFLIRLNGCATRFRSWVGVDDEKMGLGSVSFQVWVDDVLRADSGVVRGGMPARAIEADLRGADTVRLVVGDGGDNIDCDHADWAEALFVLMPGATAGPAAVRVGGGPPMEIAHGTPAEPAIHGPRIVGATPDRPFLYRVPATGEGDLRFGAEDLPADLEIDPETGIISGSLRRGGETVATLTVESALGTACRRLKIVAGEHRLALTPPMGWNSWNCWATTIDAAKVRDAADWMVRSGLAAHGYQYVNIDDTWEGERDENGGIQANAKFGDMKALADYVHAKGLKLGLYSSPGPKTCAGFEGSLGHEEQDARTWAEWGIDYIKYDWCSYNEVFAKDPGIERMKAPYRLMRTALDRCGRDIVYSLCQYGMGDVWEWGAEVGGNCWRTTGDITDSWGSMSAIAFGQSGRERFAGPGHWNDIDMLVVGDVGWGPNLHPTRLTPDEHITHITMWCLLSSPLLIGCDLSRMDAFTIDLLTNDEVLEVNQDPLGRPASRRAKEETREVWARPLWDGTMAVGLCNRGVQAAKVTTRWRDLGIEGPQPVRDLWRKVGMGTFSGAFTAEVPAHGAVLLKIGTPERDDW